MKVQQLKNNNWKRVFSLSRLCGSVLVTWGQQASFYGLVMTVILESAVESVESGGGRLNRARVILQSAQTRLTPIYHPRLWEPLGGVGLFDFQNPFINGVTPNVFKYRWQTPPKLPSMQSLTGETGKKMRTVSRISLRIKLYYYIFNRLTWLSTQLTSRTLIAADWPLTLSHSIYCKVFSWPHQHYGGFGGFVHSLQISQ